MGATDSSQSRPPGDSERRKGDGRRPGAKLTGQQLRAAHLWCRRRAERKLKWCTDIQPHRLRGVPHQEIRSEIGLTPDEYSRARRWLEEAIRRCLAAADGGKHLEMTDALREIADEHVDRVMHVGVLLDQGLTQEQVRQRLDLSRDTFELALGWWRDALDAATDRRG